MQNDQNSEVRNAEVNPFARCPQCGSTSVCMDPMAKYNEDTLRCSECHITFHVSEALP